MPQILFDTRELRPIILSELEQRRRSPAPGDYAYQRTGDAHLLYGVTGAANLYAEWGVDSGGWSARQAWCDRINAFQTPDGAYQCVSGPEHAAAMALAALNLLGGHPARPIRHLAPLRAGDLDGWLNRMDWAHGTHKEFCCGVSPLLASGLVDAEWIATLRCNVENRLDPAHPDSLWMPPGDLPPWRVISCLYHVLSGYDAGGMPYPCPDRIWDRLMALDYPKTRNADPRTYCTDFDYAWMLIQLCRQRPEGFADLLRCAAAVLDLMAAEWHEDRDRLLAGTTHELYCHGIGWAVYQALLPDRFAGPPLRDTLNAPWLYRLPGPEWVATG
jgi:hypothetical protein